MTWHFDKPTEEHNPKAINIPEICISNPITSGWSKLNRFECDSLIASSNWPLLKPNVAWALKPKGLFICVTTHTQKYEVNNNVFEFVNYYVWQGCNKNGLVLFQILKKFTEIEKLNHYLVTTLRIPRRS